VLESHLVPFARWLEKELFGRGTIQTAVVVAREFLIFLAGKPEPVSLITREDAERYLKIRAGFYEVTWHRSMTTGYDSHLRRGIKIFLRFLSQRGVVTYLDAVRDRDDPPALPKYRRLLAAYQSFLLRHRGLKPRTVSGYSGHIAAFCRSMAEAKLRSWNDLSPHLLYDHLLDEAKRLRRGNLRRKEQALRGFLGFLKFTGRSKKDYRLWLVNYRTWRLSSVPKTVTDDELDRLFNDTRRNRPGDLRDRAVFMLLTLYGLRIGEIAGLRLDEIRWEEKRLLIRRRKAGKDLSLPLHPLAAWALNAYIEKVRPHGTGLREVFLTRYKGNRPYPAGFHLGLTIRHRLRRLGIPISAHGFRHALASRLQNNGCPPVWIQKLLGHAQFESTRIYAKVDMTHLREVAENDGVAP
jgi:site-specific recombinase XerD